MTPLPCPHDMPNAATCLDCMEDGPVATPDEWRPIGQPIRAMYPGSCIGCDAMVVEIGDRVQRWGRGAGRTAYLHEGCTP